MHSNIFYTHSNSCDPSPAPPPKPTQAALKACEVLEGMSLPVDLTDREALIRAATTSLSSKVVAQYSGLLAPMAVDAIYKVMDPSRPNV